jgi:hypothetical protein
MDVLFCQSVVDMSLYVPLYWIQNFLLVLSFCLVLDDLNLCPSGAGENVDRVRVIHHPPPINSDS